MRRIDEGKTTINSTVAERIQNRLRSLRCFLCPPNKGCNAHGKRRPRPDQYKKNRRFA